MFSLESRNFRSRVCCPITPKMKIGTWKLDQCLPTIPIFTGSNIFGSTHWITSASCNLIFFLIIGMFVVNHSNNYSQSDIFELSLVGTLSTNVQSEFTYYQYLLQPFLSSFRFLSVVTKKRKNGENGVHWQHQSQGLSKT